MADAAHPDSGLVELGRSLHAAWIEQEATLANLEAMPAADADAAANRVLDASRAIVDRIVACPALTADGVAVKVLAWAWCQGGPGQVFEPLADNEVTDERAITSAARDVVRLMGIVEVGS